MPLPKQEQNQQTNLEVRWLSPIIIIHIPLTLRSTTAIGTYESSRSLKRSGHYLYQNKTLGIEYIDKHVQT